MRIIQGQFNQQQAGGPADISTTGRLGHWKFNEGAGTAAVSETGDHQGTLVGTPGWVSGISGTAVSLNGTSQYVNITRTTALDITSNAVSVMAWINPTTTSGDRRIVNLPSSETNGYEKYSIMLINGNAYFWVRAYNGTIYNDVAKSATFTTTGSWSHICGVYNGTDMRLYINGSLQGSAQSLTGNLEGTSTGDLQIGRFGPTFGQYFSGSVDEVRIYSRAISSTEVSTVYSLG